MKVEMGCELGCKALQLIVGYEKEILRFEGTQICFGRRCDGRIERLGKTRGFGKLV